ncbi:Appr-1-p processing protein [Candidatus Saccharibacteria bacterium RAAC3_TM7_1]|nr:Appr-1-p processing protein [Candidatus Saccharibacteria bacterium RAAC3_TM7_1]
MIKYVTGDLTTMEVDVIVNAANTGLVGGAGLCGMIHDAAGPEIDVECRKIGYCLRGDAEITKGYNLPAKFVIHTVGPIYGQHHGKEPEILYSCYYESMRLADEYNLTSIAFPYISTGIYLYPKEEAKGIAVGSLTDYLEDNPNTSVKKVVLVEYDG